MGISVISVSTDSMDPEAGGDTVAAAMTLLANTDALIIDLRQNGWWLAGDGAADLLLLFEGEPVHLNDLYFRPTDRHAPVLDAAARSRKEVHREGRLCPDQQTDLLGG